MIENKNIFKQKGFTLIELLVVVAIIGILTTIVVVLLNNAKAKGEDSTVKSNLRNAINQGEIFYNTRTTNQSSYSGVCTNGVVNGAKGVGFGVLAAAKAVGLSSVNGNGVAGGWNMATCHDSSGAWAAEVPLKTSTSASPQMWCVDNVGKSKLTTVPFLANQTACL